MTAIELEYFTANGYFFDVQQPLAGGSTGQPQFSVISGYVTFTPRMPATIYVNNLDIGGNVGQDVALAATAITGQIVDGVLCSIDMNGDPGVKLLANSAPISTALASAGYNTLVYDVSFTDIVYAHQGFTLGNFAFEASSDTTAVVITDPDLTRYTYAAAGTISPALDDAPLNTYYTKPSGGIPATDLSSSVQTQLASITKYVPLSSLAKPMGLTVNTDATVTVSGTQPSYTGIKQWPYTDATFAQHAYLGGIWSTYAGNGFNLTSGADPANVFFSFTGYELEFLMSGQDVAFYTYSNGKSDFRIFIDEQPCTVDWEALPSGSGAYYIIIHTTSTKIKKVRAFMGINSLSGIFMPGASQIWAPNEPRRKMIIIGDSYVQGPYSTSEGVISAGTICGRLAQKLGWTVFNNGQGGTGYLNPGANSYTSAYGSTSRMTALAALPAADVVMVWGGANDSNATTYPTATVIAAANTLWNAIAAARPASTLIVAGPEPGNLSSFNSSNLDALNMQLKAAALANPNVDHYIDMRTSSWLTGTGNLGTPANDGLQDFLISSDGTHPTWAGFEHLTNRVVADIGSVPIAI